MALLYSKENKNKTKIYQFKYLNVRSIYIVDGRSVDVQYSNWTGYWPRITDDCAGVFGLNEWLSYGCNKTYKYVCQS